MGHLDIYPLKKENMLLILQLKTNEADGKILCEFCSQAKNLSLMSVNSAF